jgi:hypothetical protein
MTQINIKNHKLKPLSFLIGKWETHGSHPLMPGIELRGKVSFGWLEGGAFIIMHSEIINEPKIPVGVAIFGSDDDNDDFSMIYFDERGVSRQYKASLSGNIFKWWRFSPKFSQVFTCTIKDETTMIGKGRMLRDGKNWEDDIELTYTRIDK